MLMEISWVTEVRNPVNLSLLMEMMEMMEMIDGDD